MLVVSESGDLLDLGAGLRESSEDCTDVGTWLHGDNSKLVFFVDPDEESLFVVVEDASALWPVAVETACLKESVALLEQEVVSDELVALGISHRAERVEGTLELSVEGVACLDNLLLDGVPLLASDGWAKRELSQVAADSNASRFDHSCVLGGEGWALKFSEIHVADMLGSLGVPMVLLDDFVHERGECGVRIMRSSINSDSRVSVLGA